MDRVFKKVEACPCKLYKAWSRVFLEYDPFFLLFASFLHIFSPYRFIRVSSQRFKTNMASNADAHRVSVMVRKASAAEFALISIAEGAGFAQRNLLDRIWLELYGGKERERR